MAGRSMQLEDWLDDLCVRFIINLPQEDLSSVARICFQVEEAQWFYEDFIRPLDPSLPSMTLRTFCLRIFQHCPLLASFSVENHIQAFEEFLQYKTRVPVRGAILLNHDMDSVVLVKGWKKGANWSFPRGKINKDEDDLDCAIREVYEETGLDLREAGLVPTDVKPKYIEIPMREQHLRLYVFRDVPMDTNFQPRTRKEISKIDWYKLSELPTLRKKGTQNHHQYDSSGPGTNANKFYMVTPFLIPLKKWIVSQQKKVTERGVISGQYLNPLNHHLPIEEEPTEDESWAPASVSNIPPIESLDGATRELQRLLNMQPKTEAPELVPAPPPENKASALLSLLQPSNPAAATMGRPLQPPSQMPHTPADLTISEAGQPQDPHHHTNNMRHGPHDMHHPPPSFVLPPNQVAPGWNLPPNQAQSHGGLPPQGYPGYPGHVISPPYQGYNGGQQNYTTNPVSLIQPPPLPQQSQTTAYGGSMFPQGLPPASHPGTAVPNFPIIGSQPLPFGQPGQMPLQPQLSPSLSRQTPLNGQALALLNAFKQGHVPPAPNEPPKEAQQPQQLGTSPHVGQQYSSPYSQYAAPQRIPSVQAGPKSPSELAGSAVGPPHQTQHKSALLDLFKKQGSDAATNQISERQEEGKEAVGSVIQADKELLAQLQGTIPASRQRAQVHPNVHPETLPINRLSIHKKDKYSNKKSAGGSPLHARTTGKSPSSARNTKAGPPQPTRILQRGQTLQSISPIEKPQSPFNVSVYTSTAQPRSVNVVNPTTALPSAPSPGAQTHRPDVSQEQKRQLLSLFGAQQSMQTGSTSSMRREPSHQGSSTGETPRSRIASIAPSRTGNETPISPADQSFLLDYLQSVTNNAGR
ncbi:mRNA decapping complex subunit 2 [Cladobotryum mycophilum]|uniref:mRNA decapping complex subunit 2 n=1 Tax=Cladobotryum mycophilum TaxID=491253 RepID=A0ABR0S9F7_9HYPO